MTKGTSPKAKVRDLQRLLEKRGDSLTIEVKTDIQAKIAQYQNQTPKPPKRRQQDKKSTKAGGKVTDLKRLDVLRDEVYQLRVKLLHAKEKQTNAQSSVQQEKIARIEKELVSKDALYKELTKSKLAAKEAEKTARKEKKKAERKGAKADAKDIPQTSEAGEHTQDELGDQFTANDSSEESENHVGSTKEKSADSLGSERGEINAAEKEDLVGSFFNVLDGDEIVMTAAAVATESKPNRKGDRKGPRAQHRGLRTRVWAN